MTNIITQLICEEMPLDFHVHLRLWSICIDVCFSSRYPALGWHIFMHISRWLWFIYLLRTIRWLWYCKWMHWELREFQTEVSKACFPWWQNYFTQMLRLTQQFCFSSVGWNHQSCCIKESLFSSVRSCRNPVCWQGTFAFNCSLSKSLELIFYLFFMLCSCDKRLLFNTADEPVCILCHFHFNSCERADIIFSFARTLKSKISLRL